MSNLIKIIIGGLLFFFGISYGFGVFYLLTGLVGCYFLSRPIALDSEYKNKPVFFLVGMFLHIPSYFLTRNILDNMGYDPPSNEIWRITFCLVTGVFSFLSICKKNEPKQKQPWD